MLTPVILTFAAMLQAAAPVMKVLDSGQNSAATAARQVVVRSSQEWEGLWPAVSSTRPRPPVDFSKNMVVGVFLGQRPTGGYGVQIVKTREDGRTLVVEYRETKPAPGTLSAQVLTAPYVLVEQPTFAGEVRFERVN
jgi:hypothetical protein